MSPPQFGKTSTAQCGKTTTQHPVPASRFTRKSNEKSSRKERGTLQHRYYGRSDSCRAVLRASAAMNAVLSPSGLPACFAHASCHSVSNHPPANPRLFLGSLFLSARGLAPAGLLRFSRSSCLCGSLGLRGGLRTALAGPSRRLAVSTSCCLPFLSNHC